MGSLLPACEAAPPDAALFASALADGVGAEEALAACERIRDPAVAGECHATLVRAHPGLPAETCEAIADPLWSGECWFTVGEREAAAGRRWAALEACGRATAFYDECLYHAWTAELGAAAAAAPDAVSALEAGRDSIAFWSDLQTLEGSAADQLWGDFWFFAHNAHRPADLEACKVLEDPGERERCREGTRTFVLRALVGELLAPGRPPALLDRVCRSGELPPLYLEGLHLPHPELDSTHPEAAALACEAAEGRPVRRWNPVFRGSRRG